MQSATCIAPVNIAVIKYWGKRDEDLILPFNDSISGTLSMEEMRAKTTIAVSPEFDSDRFWLNGVEVPVTGIRLQNVLKALRNLAEQQNPENCLHKQHVRICSENNFPTAAGLASSAAGFACLVKTLAELYGIQNTVDLTALARQGSGSACRSLHGGFVQWKQGTAANGEDSVAVQLATENHWPEMRVLVVVVTDVQKKVSSSHGMATTVKTSELYKHRVTECVAKRVDEMKAAIADKDFERFAKATMIDSNQFHAVCLDSYPPIKYMNDVSHKIANLVHVYNTFKKSTKVAYTFDAGPNACLYLLEDDVSNFLSLLNLAFPSERVRSSSYMQGIRVPYMPEPPEGLFGYAEERSPPEMLRYIIHTRLGTGAHRLVDTESTKHSLLDEQGMPFPTRSNSVPKRKPTRLLRFVSKKHTALHIQNDGTNGNVTETHSVYGIQGEVREELMDDDDDESVKVGIC